MTRALVNTVFIKEFSAQIGAMAVEFARRPPAPWGGLHVIDIITAAIVAPDSKYPDDRCAGSMAA